MIQDTANIVLVGASGLAREVLASVRHDSRQRVIGLLDDNARVLGSTFSGVPVLGGIDDVGLVGDARLLICVGAGRSRERLVSRLAGSARNYATVVDSSVRNPAGCAIGPGSIVLANVTITADAVVGSHVVIMPGVTITHDDVIEDFATIAAGVSLGGGVRVARAAYLGMNSSVRPGVTAGAYSTLGMGAALLFDLPDNETWVGVPARPLGSRHPASPLPRMAENSEGIR